MSQLLIPLPQLTQADPPVAGEGSLDPLGLAQVADRLAERLLPGLRARMRRVRFLTISAIEALAAVDLHDTIPVDGISSPSICFEWLVLEGFARKNEKDSPLEAAGVPGSAKVRGVLAQGKRLAARNYLKSPSVFGFTGVYMPLSRHLQVLDEDRRLGCNVAQLGNAGERDCGLEGFTDARPGTAGAALRKRIRAAILASLQGGQCVEAPSSHLWKSICDHLHPTRMGECERTLLASWMILDAQPVRRELAGMVGEQPQSDEFDLVRRLLAKGVSTPVKERLEAITAYEDVVHLLESAFTQLRHVSTHLGTQPMSATKVAQDPVIVEVSRTLPQAVARAAEQLERLDGELVQLFSDRLAKFETRMSAPDLVETLLAHHGAVQAGKPPQGKRPWFDRHGAGWVIRSLYRHSEAIDLSAKSFVHPYRLSSLQGFMKDLAP